MKTLNDFKKEFKLITVDNYADALDAWFESVGQLYVHHIPIPTKFEYKPAKPIISFDRTINLNEDSYFHEMFDVAPDVLLLEISEYLFRYVGLLKKHGKDY